MIKRVKLENWRSHKSTELEFDSGTNVLVGAMGSGKSSVMNAICFALFGTFPELQRRETKIDEVVMEKPSRAEGASVELEFTYNGNSYRVERELHRGTRTNTAKLFEENSFLAGPKVSDVNERVERIIELNYELFSRAVYSEQNQMDYFIRLNPGERKQKFDELLGLDTYGKVRKNAVAVGNTLKKLAEEKRKDLKEQAGRLEEWEREKIGEKLALLEAKIKQKEKEKSAITAELGRAEKEAEAFRGKREEFSELKEKRISLEQAAASLKEDIREIERFSGVKVGELDREMASALEIGLKEKGEKLEEMEEEFNKLKGELSAKKARLESLEEENASLLSRLPEKARSLDDLDREIKNVSSEEKEIEKKKALKEEKLKSVGEREKELGEKISVCGSREKEEQGVLEQIKKETASCPLCKTALTGKSRKEIIANAGANLKKAWQEKKEAEKGLSGILGERKGLEKEIRVLEEELKSIGEIKALLGSLKEPVKRFAENREKTAEAQEALEALGKKEKALEEKGIEAQMKKIEEEKRKAEKIVEGIKKNSELCEKKRGLEETMQKIKSLGFDEEKALAAERLLEKKKGELKSSEIETAGLEELVKEKRKREAEIKERREEMEKAGERLGGIELGASRLGLFVSALKAAQAELRESLVETINEAMDTVWKRLYPYGDYVSAKMEIDQGNYELKVKTRAGHWRRIEGLLSGGERSSVALALKISFSLVLARNLGILILDEPTHNLDETAVSKLSEMMREHLGGLVEQVFLITHNKEMEKAANASLYLLERDKEMEGITRAELLSIAD